MNKSIQKQLEEILARLNQIEVNGKNATLWRWPEVERRTGLKKSRLHELIKSGDFPRPVKLSSRARAFRASEITEWILSRPRVENQTKEAV